MYTRSSVREYFCRGCSRAYVVISEKGKITATENSRARERFLEDSSAHEYWTGETEAFEKKIKTKTFAQRRHKMREVSPQSERIRYKAPLHVCFFFHTWFSPFVATLHEPKNKNKQRKNQPQIESHEPSFQSHFPFPALRPSNI